MLWEETGGTTVKFYWAVLCAVGLLMLSEVIVALFTGITNVRPNAILEEITAMTLTITMAILWRCK